MTERVLKLFLSLNHSFLVQDKKKGKIAIQIQKELCFTCNYTGEIIFFCLTGANVDDKSDIVWSVDFLYRTQVMMVFGKAYLYE